MPENWTATGLIEHILHHHNNDETRNFCFIIGAGASIQSGIPGAQQLAQQWVRRIASRQAGKEQSLNDTDVEAWFRSEFDLPDFSIENSAAYYPFIYEKCFDGDLEMGLAEIERHIDFKHPSIGYFALARILTGGRHRVAITTNFDKLVSESIFQLTGRHPRVCLHESQAAFAVPHLRRPLVVKIHGDFLFESKSRPAQVSTLHDAWKGPLEELFAHYTPIFLGYGGHDGGFMNFLYELDPDRIPGRVHWCYYWKNQPEKHVEEVVSRLRGTLTPIYGFDEFMMQLYDAIEPSQRNDPLYSNTIQSIYDNLAIIQAKELDGEYGTPGLTNCINSTIKRISGWQRHEFLARNAGAGEKRKEYIKGFVRLKLSSKLAYHYAHYLATQECKHVLADIWHRRAIRFSPEDPNCHGNYANFLARRGSSAAAELYYRRAIELAETDPNKRANYAAFLLANNRLFEAKNELTNAASLINILYSQVCAEILFYAAILQNLQKDNPDRVLGMLKHVLLQGYPRFSWSFETILDNQKGRLNSYYDFFCDLGAAVLDERKVANLDKDVDWKSISPLSFRKLSL